MLVWISIFKIAKLDTGLAGGCTVLVDCVFLCWCGVAAFFGQDSNQVWRGLTYGCTAGAVVNVVQKKHLLKVNDKIGSFMISLRDH